MQGIATTTLSAEICRFGDALVLFRSGEHTRAHSSRSQFHPHLTPTQWLPKPATIQSPNIRFALRASWSPPSEGAEREKTGKSGQNKVKQTKTSENNELRVGIDERWQAKSNGRAGFRRFPPVSAAFFEGEGQKSKVQSPRSKVEWGNSECGPRHAYRGGVRNAERSRWVGAPISGRRRSTALPYVAGSRGRSPHLPKLSAERPSRVGLCQIMSGNVASCRIKKSFFYESPAGTCQP
jgi:hypothetical protein